MIYRLPIDTKSLYCNIKNDNVAGHTATVATPLKQGNSYREDLGKIMNIPERLSAHSKECLISSLIEKSRAEARIIKVCAFDKISVNGIPLEVDTCFCIYIREEIAEDNVHCGRQKVHYPSSLKYEDDEVEINNKKVLFSISERLCHYAFIVDAFEYDVDTGVLNFDIIIVGPNEIPYSKVFINRRGVGDKYIKSFVDDVDNYDTEVIALKEKMGYDNVNPDNFYSIMRENKNKSINMIKDRLQENGAKKIRILSEDYPYSIYDIEYEIGNTKKYVMIRNTATRNKSFVLPVEKINFLNDFSNQSEVILITDILGNCNICVYPAEKLIDMRKQIKSISYDASEL